MREGQMKFYDRKYGRTRFLPRLSEVAAARDDLRDARLLRRRPNQAAVVRAERILIANMPKDGT